MTGRRRKAWRAAVLLLSAATAVSAALPFVDAGRLKAPLARELARALKRPVSFEEVHVRLIPWPGLAATNLVVGEEADFGIEPFVYAGEVQAGISLRALAAGSLRISSLRLVDASVNLARAEGAGWNFVRFIGRFFAAVREGGDAPELSIRRSRINFRFGVLKSQYYLNDVNLDVSPPRGPRGDLVWQYEASPARTDRSEQGFGRFSGKGRWMPAGQGQGRFAIDVELERSAISELLTLVAGRDLGVQGRFLSRAALDGPLNRLAMRGVLEIEDVNRPAFFGLRSRSFTLPYEGVLDLEEQALDAATAKPGQGKTALPLDLRIAVRQILAAPAWEASLAFEGVPAAALLDLAHRLGLESPAGLSVEARVSGKLRMGSGLAAQGEVEVSDAAVRMGGGAPVRAARAKLELEGGQLRLEPAGIETPEGAAAELSGSWNFEEKKLEFEVKTREMKLAELRGAFENTPGLGAAPAVAACSSGVWGGALRMSRGFPALEDPPPPRWGGAMQLRNARCQPAGFPEPVAVEAAAVELDGQGWRARVQRGQWGQVRFRAAVRRAGPALAPLQVNVEAERAGGEDIARLLRPALAPKPGFLDRTLRRRAAAPAWLRDRRAEGRLEIGRLELGEQEFEQATGRLYWRGTGIEIADLSARWRGGVFTGRSAVRLWRRAPVFEVKGVMAGWAAPAGVFDAELELEAGSLGAGLGAAVKGWAVVSAPAAWLGPSRARHLEACVDYDGSRAPEPWKFTCFSFLLDGETWSGRGWAGPDGRVSLDLSSPQGAMKWAGSLASMSAAPAGR